MTLDSSDTFVGSTTQVAALAAGSTATFNQAYTIPNTATGNRFLLFVADSGNQVIEGDESNNVKVLPLTLSPDDTDLVVTTASAPVSALTGEVVAVSYTVKNQGTNAAGALWFDSIYLSDTPTLDATSMLLRTTQRPGQTPLAGGATYTVNDSLFIPKTARGSTQYLLFVTDVHHQLAEASEGNNVKAVPFSLAGPDLVVSNPSVAALGVPFSLSYTVTNLGAKPATKDWNDQIYISESPILDDSAQFVFLQSQTTQKPLAVGASYSPLMTVTIKGPQIGNRYLLIVTDRDNSIGDTARDNNVLAVPISLTGPDLVITSAIAPSTASVRGPIPVSWTVQNQGNAAAPGNWPDRVFLSTKPTYDFTATPLGSISRPNSTPIAASDSYTLSMLVTIPSTATGNRYLHIVADYNLQAAESNETTGVTAPVSANAGSSVTVSWTGMNQGSVEAPADWADRVYLSASPTLDASALAFPLQQRPSGTPLAPGASYTLTKFSRFPPTRRFAPATWTVKNQGIASANGTWTDAVYLSDDAILDASDVQLAPLGAAQTSLSANGTYTRSQNVTLPGNACTGNHFLLFVADQAAQQAESNETNNVKAVPIAFSTVDLTVSNASAPASANVGDTVQLSFTVTNQGNADATANWTDYIYLSDDNVFDSTDLYAASYNHGAQTLAAGASYTLAPFFTIPDRVSSGPHYILFVTDRDFQQAESSDGNNVWAAPINLSAPDLTVPTATAPSLAVLSPSVAVTVSWDVTNQGAAAAQETWTDSVYLSDQPTLDTSATLLGSQTHTSLAAGDTYTATVTFKFPFTTTGGNRYLLFVTDAGVKQGESNEANNTLARSITLGLPDLVLSDVTAPASTTLDGTIPVDWTVSNPTAFLAAASLGTNPIDWIDSVYLSDTPTFIGFMTPIATVPRTSLAPNGSYTVTQNVVIPATEKAGNRYLIFRVENMNSLNETSQANNLVAIPIVTQPQNVDLAITRTSAPAIVPVGSKVRVEWTIANQGTAVAPASWNDSVYLSDDPIFDAGDQQLAVRPTSAHTPLAGGASYTHAEDVSITGTRVGNRYLLVVADRDGQQAEMNENNNMLAIPILVTGPNVDLVPHSANAPAIASLGEAIFVSWTIDNQGSSGALSTWDNYVYLSNDAALDSGDTFVALSHSNPLLTAGGSYVTGMSLTIPGTTSIGDRYLLVQVNANRGQSETDFTNNVLSAPITLRASDLVLLNAQAPASATVGGSVALSFTVTNQGAGAATVSWSDRIYVSDKPIFDGTARQVEIQTAPTTLAPGASYNVNLTGAIPALMTPGNRYLFVITDDFTQQPESNEANNTVTMPIVLTGADIATVALAGPGVGVLGGQVALTWTVTNQGPVDAVGNWSDLVYLSDKPTFDASAITIGIFARGSFAPLALGASYIQTNNVTIPANATGGVRYLLVRADGFSGLGETDESNNVRALSIILVNTVDLTVTSASAPASIIVGDTISLSYTVKNQGSSPLTATWTDKIFLSADASLNVSGDTLIVSVPRTMTLAAGASYTVTQNVTMPFMAPGSRFLFFVTDAGNQVAETVETNNASMLPVAVTAPDLVVSSATAPPTGLIGKTIAVSWTVTNQGGVKAPLIQTDAVYVSDSPTLDFHATLLSNSFTLPVSQLAAGASYTVNANLALSANLATGARYLLFVADSDHKQGESNETNNVFAVPIAVQSPDLVASNVTAPSLTVGDPAHVTIGWTVTNVGTGIGTANTWVDSIIASPDGNPAHGVVLKQFTHTGFLAINGSYSRTETFELPAGFQTHAHLVVKTDAGDAVFENGTEANNAAEAPNQFDVAYKPFADLAISGLSTDATAGSGLPIHVAWTVTNRSLAPPG